MVANEQKLDEMAVENFREYLRIPSVHPDINYGMLTLDDCVTFIKNQANSLDLPVKVIEVCPGKPVVIISWEGTEPEKPSIMLNGHMDVVPVYPEKWTYPPFSAHIDEKGNIYARGSQDCKCVSIQHIEAIRRLKLNGIRLKRTIHITFMPEEELHGIHGMKLFVKTKDFKTLNIGFAFDEGASSGKDNTHAFFYGERCLSRIWIHCCGDCGHGSLLPDNSAGEKLNVIIDRFMKFRASEKAKLKDPNFKIGDVTSVNLTMIEGGVQMNVIPDKLSLGFDIRIAPDVDHEKFENMIKGWCEEAGKDVYYRFENKEDFIENTKLDDSNIFWVAFKKACDDSDVKLEPIICPGTTDARYLRANGIAAFGFSPMFDTPILAHDHNEFLNKDIFLRGIREFIKIIPAVANL